MTDDHDGWRLPLFSPQALRTMDLILRRGGSMRLAPLLDACRLDPDDLIAALNELDDRCWIRIVWHPRPGHRDDDASRPLPDVRRVVATRFGKWRYQVTWPA